MIAGAVLVLGSLPLALITVSGAGLTRSVSQMSNAALWPTVISIFAFARGYSAIRPTSFRTTLPILSGAFITWAAYDRWTWVKDAQHLALGRSDIAVSAGIGFWVFSAGAVLIVIGSLILQFVKPQPR